MYYRFLMRSGEQAVCRIDPSSERYGLMKSRPGDPALNIFYDTSFYEGRRAADNDSVASVAFYYDSVDKCMRAVVTGCVDRTDDNMPVYESIIFPLTTTDTRAAWINLPILFDGLKLEYIADLLRETISRDKDLQVKLECLCTDIREEHLDFQFAKTVAEEARETAKNINESIVFNIDKYQKTHENVHNRYQNGAESTYNGHFYSETRGKSYGKTQESDGVRLDDLSNSDEIDWDKYKSDLFENGKISEEYKSKWSRLFEEYIEKNR